MTITNTIDAWVPRTEAHLHLPGILGRTRHRLDWLVRHHRDDLIAAGALLPVGRGDAVHLPRLIAWLEQRARNSLTEHHQNSRKPLSDKCVASACAKDVHCEAGG